MENNRKLIQFDDFKSLARVTSMHIDVDEVEALIKECEDIYILPAVGYEVLKRLLYHTLNSEDFILLNGGSYNGANGKQRLCHGLKKALAYFTYAKLVMNDGSLLTRTGFMQHDDSYAQRETDKNRVRKYDDVMSIAETYLDSCLQYLHRKCDNGIRRARGTRCRIHAIGE